METDMELTLTKEGSIGVFDSGVGGISVLRELVKEMPQEDFLYFGDSIHAPYGTKPVEEIRALTIEHVESLLAQGAKGIVVACNTATSAAVAVLRQMYPQVPLVGIEPALKPAVLQHPNGRIIVMATPMTIRQEKFRNLLPQYEDQAQVVPLGCPGLMEYIEKGDLAGEDLIEYLEQLLAQWKKEQIDGVVLGCTHYPFARDAIQKVLGAHVAIYDGGPGTAREMRRRLEQAGLLKEEGMLGKVVFRNSRDTREELELCEKLLHM